MSKDVSVELGALISGARVQRDDPYQMDFGEMAPLPEIQWNAGQKDAIRRITRWRGDPGAPRFVKLTGPAGAGKTTVMQAVRSCLRGTRTAWSAMTGKAASRMREASGVKARTLHSVLYHPPREVDNVAEQKIDLEFETIRADGRTCLLVVDEASMIGPRLFDDIAKSAYDKVLFVGDPYQIPPVLSRSEETSRGADYSVFTEVEGPHLTEVMRTSGAVLRAATKVRELQHIPRESDSDDDGETRYEFVSAGSEELVTKLAVHAYLQDPIGHALITWRNDVRMFATGLIRQALGRSGVLPQPGEPVVVRKNVYGADIMNGDVVALEEWCGDGPTLAGVPMKYARVRPQGGKSVQLLVPTSKFDGTVPYVRLDDWRRAIAEANTDDPIPITFGYCLTGHLIQGSEVRRATTFLPGDLSNPHFRKLTKLPTGENMQFAMRFLYTAIARAKNHAGLIISGR